MEIHPSPHTSSLSDEQSNYGIDCTAVKAGIAQSLKSLGYVLINWSVQVTIAGHSRIPFVFTDTRPFVVPTRNSILWFLCALSSEC